MDKNAVISIVRSTAGSVGIDPNLAQAIAEHETACDPTKTRYEPDWAYLVTPDKFAKVLGISERTETELQKFSWGALQVMGSVARELGYQAQLPLLSQPQMGILYGCRKIHALARAHSDIQDLIAAYNAGVAVKVDGKYRNENYVQSVIENLTRIKRSPR
jgi:soluble lytic murein transglycosylase-like protein